MLKVKRIFVAVVAIFALVFICNMDVQAEYITRLDPDSARVQVESITDPLEASDILDKAWLNKEAIDLLEKVEDQNAEVLWRLSRGYVNLGENEENEDNAIDWYNKGLELAEKAVELDSVNAKAHEAIAVAAGRVALFKGPFKAAGLVKKVHRHALQAVAVGDSVPVAYFVLGRTHKKLMEKSGLARTVAGLTFAARDSIPYYLDKALEISKGNMLQSQFELGDYYMDKKTRDDEKARTHLEEAVKMPLRDEHDAEAKKNAQLLLDELK